MPRQNSRKVRIGDYEFESTLEAERFMFLLSKLQDVAIEELQVHPYWILQEGSILLPNSIISKKRTRANLVYTADFMYRWQGVIVVEDVKGAYTKTKGSHKAGDPIVSAASKLRMNIIQRRNPNWVLVMVTIPTWWWGEDGGHKLL